MIQLDIRSRTKKSDSCSGSQCC